MGISEGAGPAPFFPELRSSPGEPFGVQLRTGALKTDNRVLFMETLIQRLDDKEKDSFELRDLEGPFEPTDGSAVPEGPRGERRALATQGISLDAQELPERRRGGRVIVYTLFRLPAQPGSTSYKHPYDPEVGPTCPPAMPLEVRPG